ncbi:T9SS type A sorting domain-containing protein [Flavobacterium sp. GCM10027622]|uniref:T9SS type A sorting domain-containing protein n=1 Tax=unclassified Flavobacterium TaxID=196869 RepID=UPI00361FA648
MKTIQIKMKQYLLFLITLLGYGVSLAQATDPPRFKTYQSGTNFTSIAVDQNKAVWAGTDRAGLFKLDQSDTIVNTFQLTSLGTAPVVNSLRIQTLAADKSGNIWVGHGGTNTSNTSGGVERINATTNEVQHLSPDRDARGFTFMERDGIGTLNAQQIAVDPNNKVWIAHRYHDLTVTGPPSSSYILTPGTFSYRVADDYAGKFNSVGTWQDVISSNPDMGLPYPDYTYNPTPSQTAQSRTCNAISADRGYVWVSVFPYKEYNVENYLPSRLLQYTTGGQYVGFHTVQSARFSLGGNFHGVYANNNKGVWATTTIAGNGFSVLKNGIWYNITNPSIIPPGTRFNRAAIWGDSFGRVYMGTNKGLIVYDGSGYVDSPYSYTLYTKDPYTSPLGRSVHDPDMVSNDIIAGSIESPQKQYFSWIATTSGIMRAYLPYGDIMAYHVVDKDFPNKETHEGKENYEVFANLKKTSLSYVPLSEDIPSFAVDGTTSTVLRLKTNDPGGFYAPNSAYRIEFRKNTSDPLPGDRNSPEYIARYGQFTLKPLSDYGNNVQLQDLKYVDFIYKHPTYIDFQDFVSGKHYTEYDIFVFKRTPQETDDLIFRHPAKFCLPPVLFGHGVWSNIASMQGFEDHFKSKGYTDYETLKAWRLNGADAENPFERDANIIPTYIDNLIRKALGAKVSAGKVNVIVHSRGGLYTRAYIEEISPRFKFKKNINAFVTLNTPHAGSQAANAVMDKRVVIPGILYPTFNSNFDFTNIDNLNPIEFQSTTPKTIGNLMSLAAVPQLDRVNNWGAKNLMVVNDVLSGSYNSETRFIETLNQPQNVQKLVGIPIHAVATNFDPCQLDDILLCRNEDNSVPKILPKRLFWPLYVYEAVKFLMDDGVQGASDFVRYLYNGETNDAIVPNSSMRTGLNEPYVSPFTGENIAHIDTGGIANSSGVTVNLGVKESVYSYLKLKHNNNRFTTGGIAPPALTYNLFPGFAGLPNRPSQRTVTPGKIVIDPNSFSAPLTSGSTVTFKVYQEDLDKMIITLEYPNDSENVAVLTKSTGLALRNEFTFTIPSESLGQLKINAYGFNEGKLVTEHNVLPTISLPGGVTPQSIRFAETKVTVLEKGSHEYRLLATYSDGVERKINDLSGVVYTLENNRISRTDFTSVKGELPGQSFITATLGALTAKAEYTVEEDLTLKETLVTDFYATFAQTGPITLHWNTYQEYRSKKFILEKSTDNINFLPINEQLGQGTSFNPITYNYLDDTNETVVYYRLRLINLDDNEQYSKVIEVNRAALSNDNPDAFLNGLRLVPNPLHTTTGSINTPANWYGRAIEVNIFDTNGKHVGGQNINRIPGQANIMFEMPQGTSNGLYLIQLKTATFIKTLKLIYQR